MTQVTEHAIYRQRIYGAYVSGRTVTLAPESLMGLAPRLPYLRWLVRTCMPADRDAAILDIGCGHGAILYAVQQAGYRNGRGVDGSAEQVQAAAKLGITGVPQGDLMQALRDTADASLEFTRTSLDQLFRASGFAQVECYEDRPLPHGLKSLVRWLFWRMFRALLMFYQAVEPGSLDRRAVLSQNLLTVAGKGGV